ncbi:DUF1427 family protein [Burkholderia savannae]|uniref:DUF1427 family protein n=1 Tax=Burkholderia savannae TaxID=1637837 RepID=UPI0009EA9425|nr:DUF1427 family protein [Burkholderia savannae]
MKLYLLSLGAGVFVGVIYSLINVAAPGNWLMVAVGALVMLRLSSITTHSHIGYSAARSTRPDGTEPWAA